MNPLLPKVQTALLATGTAFSWFTLVQDYRRFFAAGGRLLELSGCIVPNPLATPCFYGALAFLGAFAWSIVILRSAPAAIRGREIGLAWLLSAGTVFAWGNFAYEIYLYTGAPKAASALSCPPGGAGATHPLLAPCFYGALIFLASLVVSVLILRASSRDLRQPREPGR